MRARRDNLAGALAIAFGCVALLSAAIRLVNQYDHGWWLVAYLALVGGVAQLLLTTGVTWVAHRVGASTTTTQRSWRAVALWNLGTILVPIGVFSNRALPVLAGSSLLLASLARHGNEMYIATSAVPSRSPGWKLAYYTVIAGLVSSVLIEAMLADALPPPA